MFDDPAFPSTPPPPPDESIRPLTAVGAALWVIGIELCFWWVLVAIGAVKEAADQDLISRLFCQIIAYTFGLFLLLRVHGPHSAIRDFVGVRDTHRAFYPLGLGLGIAVAMPAAWLLGVIEARWPPEDHAHEFVGLFNLASRPEQIAIAFGVIVTGPVLEEVLFRGAIFRPLRQANSSLTTVFVSAALFALVHIEPRRMVPIFLVGLLLGHLRTASGSLVPPILLHIGFNAVPFSSLFWQPAHPPVAEEQAAETSPLLLIGAATASVVILLLIHLVGTHGRRALAARRRD